jgi:ADP-heptose:LPS heptosyltransferase
MFAKKRIVVIRQLGGIGDCIMMSCVYRGLKEKYPRSIIQLLTGQTYQGGALIELAERNPFIDEVHLMDPYDGTTQRTIDVWTKYYAGSPVIDDTPMLTKADLVVDLNTACVDYEWNAMKEEGGIQKPRTHLWCEKAGVVPSTYHPVYKMTANDIAFMNSEWTRKGLDGKTVVGVGIAACDSRRTYGIGRAKEMCRRLTELGYTPVVIDPSFNFSEYPYFNGLRLSQIMSLIPKMSVVITPDTGLLHMAGAVGTPVVALFGPTDHKMRMGTYIGSAVESRNMVDCAPCWYAYPCLDSPDSNEHYKCMKKISEASVIEEVRRWVEWNKQNRNLVKLPVL